MTFKQAAHFYDGRLRPLRVFVWHDMEWAESGFTAEKCAVEFATTKTIKSAHICCDNNSTVECVKWDDTAFAAPGANSDGYQIEVHGFARQTSKQWNDESSRASIRQACHFIAPIVKRVGIPTRFLTDAQLRDGVTKGHTTHRQVTRVFGLSTHLDPGPNFPEGYVLEQMAAALRGGVPVVKKPAAPKPIKGVPPFPREVGDDGVIKMGDRGREVVAVQSRLVQRGWKVDIDGVFGKQTADAFTAFGREKHLQFIPGVVGPGGWAALWTAPVT